MTIEFNVKKGYFQVNRQILDYIIDIFDINQAIFNINQTLFLVNSSKIGQSYKQLDDFIQKLYSNWNWTTRFIVRIDPDINQMIMTKSDFESVGPIRFARPNRQA